MPAVYDKRHVPDASQPKFGKFAHSISRRVSVTNPNGLTGTIAKTSGKNYMELHIYEKKDVPPPGSYELKTDFDKVVIKQQTANEFQEIMKKAKEDMKTSGASKEDIRHKLAKTRLGAAIAATRHQTHDDHIVSMGLKAFGGTVSGSILSKFKPTSTANTKESKRPASAGDANSNSELAATAKAAFSLTSPSKAAS